MSPVPAAHLPAYVEGIVALLPPEERVVTATARHAQGMPKAALFIATPPPDLDEPGPPDNSFHEPEAKAVLDLLYAHLPSLTYDHLFVAMLRRMAESYAGRPEKSATLLANLRGALEIIDARHAAHGRPL